MLPSTFQTTTEKEDKIKQNLKVKLEMAKFLQGTLDEMAVQHKDRYSDSAKDFLEWFNKVRTSGITKFEVYKVVITCWLLLCSFLCREIIFFLES